MKPFSIEATKCICDINLHTNTCYNTEEVKVLAPCRNLATVQLLKGFERIVLLHQCPLFKVRISCWAWFILDPFPQWNERHHAAGSTDIFRYTITCQAQAHLILDKNECPKKARLATRNSCLCSSGSNQRASSPNQPVAHTTIP